MIIDASYFTGDIHIPQTGMGASSKVNNNDILGKFIDRYEAEILVKGLGRKLCKELYQQIDSAGALKSGADAKWDKLLNGTEFDNNGTTNYWRGLVDATGNLKESLMAYYVYYHYVKEGQSNVTDMGVKKGKSQNSTAADPTSKLVKAWRSMYKWYCGETETYYRSYYHKGAYVEDFRGDGSNDASLYDFMQAHQADFPDWSFTSIGDNINVFGL